MALMEEELQKIYNSEINVEISWFWDSGVAIKLGDPMNGYVAQTEVKTMADVIPWLQRAIATHCPDSTYIKNMGDSAPAPLAETGAVAFCAHRCPVCGEVNSFPGWSEMFAFICTFCGEPVEVRVSIQ
jgi:hypothetical protein